MMWKVWYETYVNGIKIGYDNLHHEYKYKGNAVRRARKQFNKEVEGPCGHVTYKWIVSQVNPWRDIADIDGQISITEWYCGGSYQK